MKKIPYGTQWIEEDDIDAVVNVLRGDFLTQGPNIDAFENYFAQYIGVKYAVAFSNGTAALHGAYFAAGVSVGDEVITTPLTFVATANAAVYLGAKPVFIDIDSGNYCIDIDGVKNKITEKTKVIAPVSFGGYPVDISKIKDAVCGKGIVIVEDAAHALGAVRNGLKVGKEADMTMFSFHPIKHITTGEGGIIVTDNADFAEKLKLFRSHGITKDPKRLINKEMPIWYYEMQELGYNYRITDMQAALGLSQMKKIDRFVKRRREIAELYKKGFEKVKGVVLPPDSEEFQNSYHLYPILIENRDEVFMKLRDDGIFGQVNYIPVHMQPFYKEKYGYSGLEFPNVQEFYRKELSIPMYPKMTDDEVKYVIEKIVEKVNKVC